MLIPPLQPSNSTPSASAVSFDLLGQCMHLDIAFGAFVLPLMSLALLLTHTVHSPQVAVHVH